MQCESMVSCRCWASLAYDTILILLHVEAHPTQAPHPAQELRATQSQAQQARQSLYFQSRLHYA